MGGSGARVRAAAQGEGMSGEGTAEKTVALKGEGK